MFDVPIKDIVDLVLKVDVGAYSFAAANPHCIRPTSSSIPTSWPSGCCAMPTSSAATASWPAQIAVLAKPARRPRAPFDHVGEA
jgi:hypothetical protein